MHKVIARTTRTGTRYTRVSGYRGQYRDSYTVWPFAGGYSICINRCDAPTRTDWVRHKSTAMALIAGFCLLPMEMRVA